MAKRLDLTAILQPEFEVVLPDGTTVFVNFPETKLIERFMRAKSELRAVKNSGDAKAIQALYELTADILSHNSEGRHFTAEELRDKHKVQFVHLFFIFNDYVDFINEIKNENN